MYIPDEFTGFNRFCFLCGAFVKAVEEPEDEAEFDYLLEEFVANVYDVCSGLGGVYRSACEKLIDTLFTEDLVLRDDVDKFWEVEQFMHRVVLLWEVESA